jgi:cysteinyl-tRNA synthetase
MLQLAEEKMSKSVGNIVSLRDVLDRWGREAVLLFFLGAHYRSPVDYSDEAMEAAAAQAGAFRTAVRTAAVRESEWDWEDFAAALDDDFATPRALAILHEWRAAGQQELLDRGLRLFGLGVEEVEAPPDDVVTLAEARRDARADRNWKEADRLRERIGAAGWEVQDVPEGFRLVPRV